MKRLLVICAFFWGSTLDSRACSEGKFHSLHLIQKSEDATDFDPQILGRELQASAHRYEILDDLHRRQFDLEQYLNELKNTLKNVRNMNPALVRQIQKRIPILNKSLERLRSLTNRFTGAPRNFEIPTFAEISNSYSTAAIEVGLRYRGNSDFAREALQRQLDLETKIRIVDQQSNYGNASERAQEAFLSESAKLRAEATYYQEMREVSEGRWTGIPYATLRDSRYAPSLLIFAN